ncbi:MAG: zinc-ribbon domain-containing protein [Deltaproteobacteria bacterium]|nr:zinc-ribbon domain-containing protein [Deltaproteobacteria bacterium]
MTIAITCPHCNFFKELPEDKVPAGVKWARCPQCGKRFALPTRGPASDPDRSVILKAPETIKARGTCAWENRAQSGSWKAIYETVKGVLFSPTDLFGKMTFQGGAKDPLMFGILLGSLGAMFGSFWFILMLWGRILSLAEGRIDPFTMGVGFILLMVFLPLYITIKIFITSGIMHLLLIITGAGKHRFEATLRVISYSQATQIWEVVPFVGGIVGNLWFLVVQIIGLREIHETSYWRIFVALLIPFVFILILLVAVIIFFVAV